MEYLCQFCDWISNNYEWIFSGLGIFVIGIICKQKSSQNVRQTIKSGKHSTNMQINGDYNAK